MLNEALLIYRPNAALPLFDPAADPIPYLPMNKHLAASLLQKAIRRGETGWALKAGLRLFDVDPSRFWRRLVVTLFEDVGLGDLELAAVIVASAPMRGVPALQWPQIAGLITQLCDIPKTQAANNLLHLGLYDFEEAEPLVDLPELSFDRAAQWLTSTSLVQKAKTAWMLSGVDLGGAHDPVKHPHADLERLLNVLDQVYDNALLHAVVKRGVQLTQTALPFAAGFVWCADRYETPSWGYETDHAPSVQNMGGLPSWVYDMYTWAGKRALRRAAQECPALRRTLQSIAPKPEQQFLTLTYAHFEHESAILSKRLVDPAHIALYRRVRLTGPKWDHQMLSQRSMRPSAKTGEPFKRSERRRSGRFPGRANETACASHHDTSHDRIFLWLFRN